MSKIEFKHNGKETICIFQNDNGIIFYGEAKCHELDEDVYSERKGEYIAETRAQISSLRYSREILRQIIVQEKHLANCMRQRPNFNYKNRDYQLIAHAISDHEEQLNFIKEAIVNAKSALTYYIGHK